jgi:hypothetical protein
MHDRWSNLYEHVLTTMRHWTKLNILIISGDVMLNIVNLKFHIHHSSTFQQGNPSRTLDKPIHLSTAHTCYYLLLPALLSTAIKISIHIIGHMEGKWRNLLLQTERFTILIEKIKWVLFILLQRKQSRKHEKSKHMEENSEISSHC